MRPWHEQLNLRECWNRIAIEPEGKLSVSFTSGIKVLFVFLGETLHSDKRKQEGEQGLHRYARSLLRYSY